MSVLKKVIPIFFITILVIAVAAQTNTETITGSVEGIEYDENDTAIEVGIMVMQENDDVIEYVTYIVKKKGKGLNLAELVGEMVEATGIISIDGDGNRTIEVLNFQVIDPPELEEDMPETDEDID
jgi:hypothetical protein